MKKQETPFDPAGLSDEVLLAVAQVASWLGISGASVRTLLKSGTLRATNVTAKLIKVRAGEVRRYVAEQSAEYREERLAINKARQLIKLRS